MAGTGDTAPLNPKLAGEPGIHTRGRPAVTRGLGELASEGVYGGKWGHRDRWGGGATVVAEKRQGA